MSAWKGLVNDRFLTELPHYAINEAVPEDNFFTDRNIAKHCYEVFRRVVSDIDLTGYTFIEPSAGEGCFYELLPEHNRIALDIVPRRRYIEQADFLKWYPKDKKKYIVIGNPPFGVRGAYALAFINRAFLFADMVAFILPMSFLSNGKGTNMKRVQNAYLLHSERLPANAFYTPETHERISVNTAFQIWRKGAGNGKGFFTDYDVSEYIDIFTVCSAPSRRCGMDKIGIYDCYIASTFYENVGIVKSFEEVKYGSGYGIIIKKQKEAIMQTLLNANWLKYSSDATNHCKHLRMHSIRQCLGEAGFGEVI